MVSIVCFMIAGLFTWAATTLLNGDAFEDHPVLKGLARMSGTMFGFIAVILWLWTLKTIFGLLMAGGLAFAMEEGVTIALIFGVLGLILLCVGTIFAVVKKIFKH